MTNQLSTLVDGVMWLRKKLNGTHCVPWEQYRFSAYYYEQSLIVTCGNPSLLYKKYSKRKIAYILCISLKNLTVHSCVP